MKKRLTAEIPEDLDKRFRVRVAEKWGLHHGNVRRGIIEAVEHWLQHEVGE